TPTDEQAEMHDGYKRTIAAILGKKFISEMDLLRLQKTLLMCRMCADSTFLVDKKPPGYSSKLEEMESLLSRLTAEENRKIILFSEWTTMLNLIEKILDKQKLRYVRLDGSVPQKKRQGLVREFQRDPECKLFITTNAGAVGLNLQAANTVVNVDLPWNPAVLEQRIGRAHRMGQKRPVQVFILVTEGTLEESLLATLSAKQELFLAALDPESDKSYVDVSSGIEDLKKRLEILIGTKPDEPIDESKKLNIERETQRLANKEKIADAGGQLLGAAFRFMGEILPQKQETQESKYMTEMFKKSLADCMEKDENGRLKLTVILPDESILENMAKSLSQLTAAYSGQG
ncbi:MAG: helicase-related protein, partial [bacterium]